MIDFRMNHGTSQLKEILRHSGNTLDSQEIQSRVGTSKRNLTGNTTSINSQKTLGEYDEILETGNFNILTQTYKKTHSDNDSSFEDDKLDNSKKIETKKKKSLGKKYRDDEDDDNIAITFKDQSKFRAFLMSNTRHY